MDAIFDDRDHFLDMKKKSGLTHPRLAETTDVTKLHIRSVRDLRRIIETKLQLVFCDLCLKHRPVFTSEQLLYTKAELQEHKTRGDPSGPLKQDNFKGHPKCKCVTQFRLLHLCLFCRQAKRRTAHPTCCVHMLCSQPVAGTSSN
jgi:E3 ubiquitin-protein ligase ZNF598